MAQLSDRYPQKEWEEIIANCDTQIFLGVNDLMTANFASDKCGKISVRTHTDMSPQRPIFSPFVNTSGRYSTSRASTQRPLMLPDEIMRMENNRSIVLLRGQKPLQLYKIIPTELPDYGMLHPCKISDYTPHWRACENEEIVKVAMVETVNDDVDNTIQQMILQDEPPKKKPIYQYELLAEQEKKPSNTPPEMLGNLRRYSGAGKAVSVDEITKPKS